ncbi:MAG: hypothetical protein QXU88_02605 [Candidatus Woesearchaeota archaeon]
MNISRIAIIGASMVLATVPSAFAHCPLCAVAAVGAVTTARFYGIHDSIFGVFIGALAVSIGLWTSNAMKKRGWNIPFQSAILTLLSILLTTLTLHFAKLFNSSGTLFGMPYLLAGVVIGSATTSGAFWLHHVVRRLNRGKNFMPLQGLAFMLTALLVTVLALRLFGVAA